MWWSEAGWGRPLKLWFLLQLSFLAVVPSLAQDGSAPFKPEIPKFEPVQIPGAIPGAKPPFGGAAAPNFVGANNNGPRRIERNGFTDVVGIPPGQMLVSKQIFNIKKQQLYGNACTLIRKVPGADLSCEIRLDNAPLKVRGILLREADGVLQARDSIDGRSTLVMLRGVPFTPRGTFLEALIFIDELPGANDDFDFEKRKQVELNQLNRGIADQAWVNALELWERNGEKLENYFVHLIASDKDILYE